jgi:hypothetical protein
MMKRLRILTAVLLICAMVLIGTASAAVDTSVPQKVIQTSGSGTVTGSPDRVQLSFSVQTENPDVKTAQVDNAARMTQVIDNLVAAGVPRDSIKTTGYSIYPVYQDSTGILDRKIKTYQVTNTLQVTLTDVSRAGDIIDIAVASGINEVSSIQFMLSDSQNQILRSEALKKAVVNARADADTVAGAMGVIISSTQNVDISQGYSPVVYDSSYAMWAMAKSEVPTPIQPNDVTVTAQVSITYTYQ